MERIIFWNGLQSIGSNIFSLDNGKDRLIMDFGMPNEMYEDGGNLSVTEALIEAGKLPAIPHLFNTEGFKSDLAGVSNRPYENQAVFISHLHLDHNAGLKYLPENTAVYMSEETKALYDALLSSDLEVEVKAELHAVGYNRPVKIGHYTVTFVPNDHDIVGTSSILIEVDGKKILHSGDVRKHGYHPGNIKDLTSHVKSVDLLMIEGTSFSFPDEDDQDYRSEKDLIDDFTQLLLDENRTIVINPYPRNVERLVELNRLGHRIGRPIYWDKRFSDLLRHYTTEAVCTWKKLSDYNHQVVQTHFDDIDKISELEAGVYVHMNGEPLGDYDPRYEVLMKTLEEVGFDFVDYSVSGHASRKDIIDIVKDIDPDVTVPWHTFEPQAQAAALNENGVRTFLPKAAKAYKLEEILSDEAAE